MAVTPSVVTSWAVSGTLRTRHPPRCPMVIASSALNARPRTVVPRRCHASVRAKMAAASLPWVSIWCAMVSAPVGSDGDRLVVGRLDGKQEGFDLARLVAPRGEGSEDAGIPTARVAPRVLAGAGLPRGHDGGEGGHRRGLRRGWLFGQVLGCLTPSAVHAGGVEAEQFAQHRVG